MLEQQHNCSSCDCLDMLQILLNSLEDSIMLCEYVAARKAWIIRFVNQPFIRLTGLLVTLQQLLHSSLLYQSESSSACHLLLATPACNAYTQD